MSAKKGLTSEQVIAALRKTNGNISLAARQLGVERNTVQHYIREYPTVRQAHDEAAAHITDMAEGHLVAGVMKGDWDRVRYWLENKGRERGYGRGPATDPAMNITAEQLTSMTDDELDALISKLDKLARKG